GLLQRHPPRHLLRPAAGHLFPDPLRRGAAPALPVRAVGAPLSPSLPSGVSAHHPRSEAVLFRRDVSGLGGPPPGAAGGRLHLAAVLAERVGSDECGLETDGPAPLYVDSF